jgi:hypothetical protein
MRVALSENERTNIPRLKLHTSASDLNRQIMTTHRILAKQSKEKEVTEKKVKETKNKNLLEGLGIEPKVKTIVERKVINSHGATLLNTKRLIHFTEVGQSYTKSDLSKELMMSSYVVDEILEFLNRHTNIQFKFENCRYLRIQ